jgi:hypothetical protein
MRVFVVMEGEAHYQFAYVPYGVFSSHDLAEIHSKEEVALNESKRWSNVVIVEFELDEPGFLGTTQQLSLET